MQRYLKQLIEEMHEAAKNTPAKPYYEHDWGPELDYVIEWENNPSKPMGEWFGLSLEQFPPVDKLNSLQIEEMNTAFAELWAAYNFYAEFPEKTPAKLRYELYRKHINEGIVWASQGSSIIDFCTGNCEDCDVKEYCEIKDDL